MNVEENDKDKMHRKEKQRASVRRSTRKKTADEDNRIEKNKISWTHHPILHPTFLKEN